MGYHIVSATFAVRLRLLSCHLVAAIEIAGEYVWGEYNLLVLPPSFPYGQRHA